MGKKKKNKKARTKRREKSQQKKHAIKPRSPEPKSRVRFIDRPALAEMEAPEGFRPISISQAIVEYGKPLGSLTETSDEVDFNEILQISSTFWNYSISLQDGDEDENLKREIFGLLQSRFGMDTEKASDFLEEMVERKNNLFPEEIQPKFSMIMFMKKEIQHLITDFNYNKLQQEYSDEVIEPDEEDKELIEMIKDIDRYLCDGVDYGVWEDDYFSMAEKCVDRYEKWLDDKGLAEYDEKFPFCVEIFLNFVYGYMHDDVVILKSVSPRYFQEFFSDYALRKAIVEPHEYVIWPPALKLFYRFLHEKGYIEDAQPITQLLDEIEPYFLEILRKRYG